MRNEKEKTIELAKKYVSYFELAERPDGTKFYKLKDDAPEELAELVREVHRKRGLHFPDDYVYEYIYQSLDLIAESGAEVDNLEDLTEEIEADVYTSDLLKWLSTGDRTYYMDRVKEECGRDLSFEQELSIAQFLEREEIFFYVLEELGKIVKGEGKEVA